MPETAWRRVAARFRLRQLSHWWVRRGGPVSLCGCANVHRSKHIDHSHEYFMLLAFDQSWGRPHPVRALAGIRIVHIDSGCLHSVALSQAAWHVIPLRCLTARPTQFVRPRKCCPQDGALYAWGAPLQAKGLSRGFGYIKPSRLAPRARARACARRLTG